MAAEPKHRDAIVAAAINLFRQRGFAATGMNDIVAESGAPKGSVYYYFPDGKAQIGAEALAYAGRQIEARIRSFAEAESDPAAFLRGMFATSAESLEKSGFRSGCPIAGVLLDTPPSETRIIQAAEGALALWRGLIEQVCTRAGVPQTRAAFVASVAISAFEGALMQARAAGNVAPMVAAGEALAMIAVAELQSVGRKSRRSVSRPG